MVEPLPKAQRNRVLALASRLFTLLETWEWRPQPTNPARGIGRAREEPRDRVLPPSELAALDAGLNDAEPHHPARVPEDTSVTVPAGTKSSPVERLDAEDLRTITDSALVRGTYSPQRTDPSIRPRPSLRTT